MAKLGERTCEKWSMPLGSPYRMFLRESTKYLGEIWDIWDIWFLAAKQALHSVISLTHWPTDSHLAISDNLRHLEHIRNRKWNYFLPDIRSQNLFSKSLPMWLDNFQWQDICSNNFLYKSFHIWPEDFKDRKWNCLNRKWYYSDLSIKYLPPDIW